MLAIMAEICNDFAFAIRGHLVSKEKRRSFRYRFEKKLDAVVIDPVAGLNEAGW